MTLQIGMRGCDGIVVVGDTWQYVEHGDRPWFGYHGTKIRVSPDRRIAIAGAHDMDASFAIAEEIIESSFAFQNRRADILGIGNRLAEGHDSQCLIAFADPFPSLYFFSHARTGQSKCEEVLTCIPIGDQWNMAYLWANILHRNTLNCSQLSRLGAVVITSAEKISSGTIRGLEGFTCNAEGLRLWERIESETLSTAMKTLEDEFGRAILEP